MALLFANNNSLSAITSSPASISGGGMTLISTQTASSSSTIDFTSNIDSTYKEYIFKFYNIHPATNAAVCVPTLACKYLAVPKFPPDAHAPVERVL